MKSRYWACVLLVLMLLGGLPRVSRADDAPNFLLASTGRLVPAAYSLEELEKQFSSFKHEPLNSAGYNALVMPIHYEDPDSLGDPNEAYAFSFLLSNALDWGPGNYCMRHAFFIYSRTPDVMRSLATNYDPDTVGKVVGAWKATHAVGGTLVKSKNGYSGTLEIFDTDGKSVHRESFADPRGYFDLLGDMAGDVMKFVGEPPSDALIQYLKIPRCKDMKSLSVLGSVAYMPRGQMLAAVDQLLKNDPGFSEVRSWASQQLFWTNGDQARATRNASRALTDYLSAEALRVHVFDYANSQDVPAATWNDWWQQVAKMCPEDSPLLALHGIWAPPADVPGMQHMLDISAKAAAKYPNNYYLMTSTVPTYLTTRWGRFDANVAAGMCITALRSNFLTGDGTKLDALRTLLSITDEMGRPDVAVVVATAERQYLDPQSAFTLLDALCDIGQFDMAEKLYASHVPFPPEDRGQIVIRVIDAAAMLHHTDKVDQLLSSEKQSLQQADLLPLAQAYDDCLHGKTVDMQKVEDQTNDPMAMTQVYLLACQLDVAAGTEKSREALWRDSAIQPDARPYLILLDAYDQHHPLPEMANFYRSIGWLYPEDPYMVRIADDGMKLHVGDPVVDVAKVQEVLKNNPPQPRALGQAGEQQLQINHIRHQITPWDVAAAVHQLSDQGKYQDAIDLGQRYTNFVSGAGHGDLFWASHLAHAVELQRDAARKDEN